MRQAGTVLLGRRRELALLADLGAVEVEEHGDGDEDGGDAAEERRRPLDAQPVEHVLREEREAGAGERAEEGVACDGGGGTELTDRLVEWGGEFVRGDEGRTIGDRRRRCS